MNTEQTLAAIERLHELGTPLIRDIEGIRTLLRRAEDLEQRASLVREQASMMAACLVRKARRNWSADELQAVGLGPEAE